MDGLREDDEGVCKRISGETELYNRTSILAMVNFAIGNVKVALRLSSILLIRISLLSDNYNTVKRYIKKPLCRRRRRSQQLMSSSNSGR